MEKILPVIKLNHNIHFMYKNEVNYNITNKRICEIMLRLPERERQKKVSELKVRVSVIDGEILVLL